MQTATDYHTLRALLDWQIELGADEAIGDSPVDRYTSVEEPQKKAEVAPRPETARPAPPIPPPVSAADALADAVAQARESAGRAATLEDLAHRMAGFDLCEIKKGARNFVFADGNPAARVMIVGEAPGRDEDLEGRPFVGKAGQLLDRMFAAIGLSRSHPDAGSSLYITNVLPWRPPANRAPEPAEIAMLLPFLQAHVTLADPDVIVLMGNTPCQALLGRQGITRLRGEWQEVLGKPCLPMTHPAYLLRTPEAKREAWADLLSLRARLLR